MSAKIILFPFPKHLRVAQPTELSLVAGRRAHEKALELMSQHPNYTIKFIAILNYYRVMHHDNVLARFWTRREATIFLGELLSSTKR